mmetsp:Transcript_3615/g.4096  ORF Transcript_3615/g.4096 Transcript_3615/m.4096 type:complete len:424 (+) Transcript_3615:45-1316(+)
MTNSLRHTEKMIECATTAFCNVFPANQNCLLIPKQYRKQKQPSLHCRRKKSCTITRSSSSIKYLILCLLLMNLPRSDAFRLMDWVDGETPAQHKNDDCAKVLSLSEISDLRVREIQRKLQRQHGYGSDEVHRILDKKELVNSLAYEEHKVCEREEEWKRKVMVRRSIFLALVCVILVMFRPLLEHVWEVAHINFVVYTDKKTYEIGRCREMESLKGAFGILLMSLVECLQFWLSISVILSWVMTSKYFFPVPSISISPAAMLASAAGTGGGNNPLARYGVNVGPMVITFCLRFIKGRIEKWMGTVLSEANRRQKRERKAARKEREKMEAQDAKQERKDARARRRAERELRRQAGEDTKSDTISSTTDSEVQHMEQTAASVDKHHNDIMPNGDEMSRNGEIVVDENAIKVSNDTDNSSGMNDLD